jgi:hypothetical protein
LFGKKLVEKLSNVLFTPQFRIGFLVEQTPDLDSRVALSDELTDGLGLLTATDRRRGGLRATLGRYCSSVEVPDALPHESGRGPPPGEATPEWDNSVFLLIQLFFTQRGDGRRMGQQN